MPQEAIPRVSSKKGDSMTDYACQANFSIPHSGSDYSKADLINVQGDSVQEFHQNLTALNQHCIDLIAQTGANLRAVAAAGGTLGAQTIQHDQTPQNAPQGPNTGPVDPWAGQPQNAPQNGSQQAQGWGNNASQQQAPQGNGVPTSPPPHVGPAPQCSHGTKTFLAKPYKNGKPGYWMAWACPADKRTDPTAHDLEFIRSK